MEILPQSRTTTKTGGCQEDGLVGNGAYRQAKAAFGHWEPTQQKRQPTVFRSCPQPCSGPHTPCTTPPLYPASRAPQPEHCSPPGAARSPRRAQVADQPSLARAVAGGRGSGRGGGRAEAEPHGRPVGLSGWGCARLSAAWLTAPPPAPKAADWAVPFFCLSVVCFATGGFPRDFPVT